METQVRSIQNHYLADSFLLYTHFLPKCGIGFRASIRIHSVLKRMFAQGHDKAHENSVSTQLASSASSSEIFPSKIK